MNDKLPQIHADDKEDIDRHILLYSKGWYGNSRCYKGQQLENIKIFVEQCFGLDECSDENAYRAVASCFLDFAHENDKREFVIRLFRPFGYFNTQTTTTMEIVIDQMIGKLGIVKIKGNPQFPDQSLGEPNLRRFLHPC